MKTFKIIVFALITVLSATDAFSQKYMDDIVSKACDCLESIPEDKSIQESQLELGLCMLEAASPYKKQLKKDYGIDFAKIDTQGEKLGRVIGMKMAGVCPKAVMRLVGADQEEAEETEVASENTFTGKITDVKDTQFIVFTAKSEKGKTLKFYWFTFVESGTDLVADYKTLVDKNVNMTYTQTEFFDSRIGEYRMFNVIETLEVSK